MSVAQVTPSDSGQYRCGVRAQQYRTFVLDVEGGEFLVGLGKGSTAQLLLQFCFLFFILLRSDWKETEPSASEHNDSTGWTHNNTTVHNSRSDA